MEAKKYKTQTAKEFFDEELSGEPLCEDVVINALKKFAKKHVKTALREALRSANNQKTHRFMHAQILDCYPLSNIK